MRDAGQDVPAERVGAEGMGWRRGLEAGSGVQGERVAGQADDEEGGEQRPVQQGLRT